MKTMLKVSLTIAMFVAAISAGDMGAGGYQCPPEGCPPPPCTENCMVATQATTSGSVKGTVSTSDIMVFFVKRYLGLGF